MKNDQPRVSANPNRSRRMRGFEPASGLLRDRMRVASESRGFAVTRLLTAWAEIVGPDLAAITRPVRVGHTKGGLGATLTLLAQSAQAPVVQMQTPAILEKVNAVYGYRAVARIQITQTAPTGFAEGQAEFAGAPKAAPKPIDPAIALEAAKAAEGVADDGLRMALETITRNFLSRKSPK